MQPLVCLSFYLKHQLGDSRSKTSAAPRNQAILKMHASGESGARDTYSRVVILGGIGDGNSCEAEW